MAETVCIISTVRATVHELACFVNYHINIGVDEVILFIDDINDCEKLKILLDCSQVQLIICDSVYWGARDVERPASIEERQEININYGLKLASINGFDWVIHIDSDELLMSNGCIKEILSACLTNVVRFSMKEAVSERKHYDNIFDATLFKEKQKEHETFRTKFIRFLGCERVFFEGEYFRGHAASKIAVRTNSGVEKMGIHRVLYPLMREIETDLICLLHYDCVGFENWKRKWTRRVDTSGKAVRMRANRNRQLELFKKCYGNMDDELDLYYCLHTITKYEQLVLKLLRLLVVVRVDAKLFRKPINLSNL